MFMLKKRKGPYHVALRLREKWLRNNKVNEHENVVLLYEHIWPKKRENAQHGTGIGIECNPSKYVYWRCSLPPCLSSWVCPEVN
jgi:hypothetical protein